MEDNQLTMACDVVSKPAEWSPQYPDHQEYGFPSYMKQCVEIGKCIAINKKTWNDIDIESNDSILDCPSQVVPLMIKRKDVFPEKFKESDQEDVSVKNADSTTTNLTNSKHMLSISDFYGSSAGKFLVGLGLSRVKQWYYKDEISKLRKQIKREGEQEDLIDDLRDRQEAYTECRAANSSYSFKMEKCPHCEFRTEFKSILEGHLAFPHMTPRREYKCNYCEFATRDCKQIIIHTQHFHHKKCFIEIPPQLYECPVCPYESGVKSKAATHITKCLKFFNPEKLLSIEESDYPTVTPKPITQDDIKIYEATLQALKFAALNPQTKVPHIPGLPSGLQQALALQQQQQMRVNRGPGRPMKNPNQQYGFQQKRNLPIIPQQNPYSSKNMSPQLYQMMSANAGHAQLVPIQNSTKNTPNSNMVMKNSNNSNKPNILAKNNSGLSIKAPTENIPGKSGTFVICEICDGYIKDLEQLRTHMQWIHKVCLNSLIYSLLN